MCCCNNFWTGMAVGLAAGTCLGIRLKAKERKIRRMICLLYTSPSPRDS